MLDSECITLIPYELFPFGRTHYTNITKLDKTKRRMISNLASGRLINAEIVPQTNYGFGIRIEIFRKTSEAVEEINIEAMQ